MKVSIRPAEEKDAKFFAEMMADKDYQKHYLERLVLKGEKDAGKYIKESFREREKGKWFLFTVLLDKNPVGILDVYKVVKKDGRGSIGYGIAKKHWGKGIGSEACALGLKFMKEELKLHSVEATADPENAASLKVLEKSGFERIGSIKDYYLDRGKYIDRVLYWKIL